MKKKLTGILAFVLCLCLTWNSITSWAGGKSETGKISAGDVSGKQGDTIQVPVTMATNPGIVSVYIAIGYDSSVMELESVTDAKLLTDYQAGDLTLNPFALSWEMASADENITSTGVLAYLNFTISDAAEPGDYKVTVAEYGSGNIYDVDLNDVSFEFAEGTITVEPAEHEHVFTGKKETVKEATCTDTGISRIYCSVNGCNEYTETVIQANGHTPGEWQTKTEATCTEAGLKEQYCTVCGDKVDEKSISANGHTLGEWQIKTEATCTEAGLKEQYCTVCGNKINEEIINASGHSYGEWVTEIQPGINKDGQKKRTCTKCGDVETQAIPAIIHGEDDHVFNGKKETVKEATCTEDGTERVYCSFDGCDAYEERVVPAIDHVPGEWQIIKDPTCTENGVKVQYCTICGQKYSESVIIASGHNYGDWKLVKEAAIGVDGEEERICGICSHRDTRIIPAIIHNDTDHTFDGKTETIKEATCTEDGTERVYCSFSGCDVYEEHVIPATKHTPGEWIVTKEPTCTEQGEKETICSICQQKLTENIIAQGHTYSDWEVVKEASFHEDGKMKRVCEVCQDELTAVIPKLSESHTHDFSGEQKIVKEATCTEKGLMEITCSHLECDAVKSIDITAQGHSYGEWTIINKAGVGTEGLKERTCSLCGEKEQEKILALEKNESAGQTKIKNTSEKNKDSKTVKTGDSTNILLCITIFGLSAFVILIVMKKKRLI